MEPPPLISHTSLLIQEMAGPFYCLLNIHLLCGRMLLATDDGRQGTGQEAAAAQYLTPLAAKCHTDILCQGLHCKKCWQQSQI